MSAQTRISDELLAAAGQGTAIALWARRQPEVPAIVSEHGNRTFAELNARANQLARGLRRRGLRNGDAVALMCTNRPEFAEVWTACHVAGLRLTPINFHLTGAEAGYIVNDCEAKAFIADARLADAACNALAATSADAVRLAIGGDIAGFESYDDAPSGEAGDDLDDPALGGVMLYTSGTTGQPKGVHRPVPPPLQPLVLSYYGYREGDVHLCTGPLYHAAPLGISLAVPLTCGIGVVLMDKWDAEPTLQLIERYRVTHTHMVPTMFHRLLALPEAVRHRYDSSSLRFILHGAAPCPVHVKQKMIEWLGPIVNEYYAATEGLGTTVDSRTWLTKPGTVGKPNPPAQVLVGDERAQPLPPGTVGFVWLLAPRVGRFEYFKDGRKTADSYRGEYFTLGDMGYLDEDGYLFLTDRSANLIISGGVNIYPAEVDAVLLDHPAVGDVATIGVPNDEWGEEVKAVVELTAGVPPSPALASELIEFCRGRLAHFKCPRSVDFIDKLPRLDSGKIYKRLLRERYRKVAPR
ncbi:MAG TPA: AMP-binding protein [Candidatus Kryptonia bacterium]|nr:AMP-binding protein [Candidatus Kryptonia bacterium]